MLNHRVKSQNIKCPLNVLTFSKDKIYFALRNKSFGFDKLGKFLAIQMEVTRPRPMEVLLL